MKTHTWSIKTMAMSRLSIKHILFLIVVIIALPALFIIFKSGIEQRNNAVQDAKRETQKLAEAIVSEQKNLIASTRQLFIALSQLPEVREHRSAELQAVLIDILSLSPQYSKLFIADLSGRVWASSDPLSVDSFVHEKRYFKNALASGLLSSGEYSVESNAVSPSLNFGYPIKDEHGAVTAVLCANLSLAHYRKIFESYRLPKGASVALIDHNGTILARAVEPEKYVGTQSKKEILQYMLEGPDEETSIGTSSIIGDSRIQTYRKLILDGESEPYMYIRAGIPTRVVMGNSDAALLKNLFIYSVVLLLGFILSWVIGKKLIIDRILVLQRSSQRLAAGDLNTRVAHEVGSGELGLLGQTFDEMAAKLATRDEELRASVKNYRDIFHATHDALLVCDEAGRILQVNKAAEEMFGYSRESLLQMTFEELLAGQSPYSFADALDLIGKSLEEGTQQAEWLSKKQNSEVFWCEVAMTPSGDLSKREILAVIRDITDRKEMERMREALLSTISHEMRTPLAAMLGFLEYVIENQVKEAELNEYHQIMYKEGERLNEMVTNFLDMQRLKAKISEYVFIPVEIRPLVEGAVAIFDGPFTKHVIVVDLPENIPPLHGEGALLHQALVNLISNAIKYSPEGSEVVIQARLEDDRAILSVQDHGVGVPAEFQEEIFNLFYRVQSTSTRYVAGTGLGLSLVKEIVQIHQGHIWVESISGQGSTFSLSLPVVTTEQAG